MPRHNLFVRLGAQRYLVERPWGDVPQGLGSPSDVACDAEGHVYCQLRQDPYAGTEGPAVVVLNPDGRVFVVDRDAQEIIIFDKAGKRLGGIGRRGYPGEPFNAPCDVAFAPDGTIYVADGYAASRIHRFSAEGTPMGGWGTPGEGPGEFSTPHGIWVLPDGRVTVADRENNRVCVFSPEGVWLADWRNVHKPMAVHGAPEGGLYVTDQVPSLSLLSGEGALVGKCRPILNGAHGMWRGPDGAIFLSEINPPRLTKLVPVAE